MIITKTPFRISLFGGGTDMPEWYSENGGEVISFAIDKYCYLTARELPPFFDHKYRVAYSKVETVRDFTELQHPVIREVIRKYGPNLNLEIHHDGDLPARSGMGSSSAFTVGMIHAILALQQFNVSQIELAQFAIDMEQNILKENVGSQDQIACAIGGINRITFGPGKAWNAQKIDLDIETKSYLENCLVLVFTGVSRNSSEINTTLRKGLFSKSKFLEELKLLTNDAFRILISGDKLDKLGEMLDLSWNLKKQLNNQSSNNHLDEIYSKALGAGATGGKILGAGGGGFFLFWVPHHSREKFDSSFDFGVRVPFRISEEGSSVVYNSRTILDRN